MRVAGTVAVLALAVLASAGCATGTGSPATGSPTGRATSSAAVLAVWQRFAVCARAHGVPNLPDPAFGPEGKITFPGETAQSAPDGVRQACGHILDALPPDASAQHPPTDIAGLLRYARCMRGHGFPDWPDPKADGTFPASQLPSTKTPALIDAMQSCDHLNPDPGGHVYGS